MTVSLILKYIYIYSPSALIILDFCFCDRETLASQARCRSSLFVSVIACGPTVAAPLMKVPLLIGRPSLFVKTVFRPPDPVDDPVWSKPKDLPSLDVVRSRMTSEGGLVWLAQSFRSCPRAQGVSGSSSESLRGAFGCISVCEVLRLATPTKCVADAAA